MNEKFCIEIVVQVFCCWWKCPVTTANHYNWATKTSIETGLVQREDEKEAWVTKQWLQKTIKW